MEIIVKKAKCCASKLAILAKKKKHLRVLFSFADARNAAAMQPPEAKWLTGAVCVFGSKKQQ